MDHLEFIAGSIIVGIVALTCIVGLLVAFQLQPSFSEEFRLIFRVNPLSQNFYWLYFGEKILLVCTLVVGC
jgi:hypothetical protein